MVKLDKITEKISGARQEIDARIDRTGSWYSRAKSVIGVIVMVLFHLRKVVLAIPVVYYALKLAAYNSEHLPEMVGINLQASGAFADLISRNSAIMWPLAVTGACLVLMFFSKKALFPWAVSIFTLVLPILLWFSNAYPM
jgi:hypothetical protein